MRVTHALRWAAVVTAGVMAGGLTVVAMPAAQAGTRPAFQMPFKCGQKWAGETRRNHSPRRAVDYNRPNDRGDAVLASAKGKVVRVGHTGGDSYGRYIEIAHGNGWRSFYAHLSGERVFKGERVRKGERIGSVGSSGGSTGPHLHYEQRHFGSPVAAVINGNRVHYYGTRVHKSRNCR
ncbi:MAG: M23 family metallopeptidase [Micromonosporaceae bacterium]